MSTPAPKKPAVELSVTKLEDYRQRGAHVLVPQASLRQMSPLFQVAIEMVNISPNKDDKDVWEIPGSSGKLGLSKQGLLKIARAAGVEFLPATVDAERQGYIRMNAGVRKRNASGAWEITRGTYEIDMEVIGADIKAAQRKKIGKPYGPKTEAEAMEKADAEILKFVRHRVGRCETGAYLRAIRAILSIKGDYTAAELGKPFIVPAVHFSPDMTDPEMRAMVVNAGRLAIHELWGGTTADASKLEADTGSTLAQLRESRDAYHEVREGTVVEVDEEDDPMIAAVRGATPADARFGEDETP